MGVSGAVIGLVLGIGLFCIWWSFWPPPPPVERRPPGWYLRYQDTLVQAGFAGVPPWVIAVLSGGFGAVVALVVTGASTAPAVGVCFGVIAARAPGAVVSYRAGRRRADLRQLWPDVVDNLASAIRAGLSLPEALAQVGDRGPVPLRPAFARFAQDYRATGRFQESVLALKDRLADPVADRLVEAVRITRDVGGSDLGRLLRTFSAFLREDLRTRGELEARQSWTVAAARLAVAAPWLVLALLASRPGALAAYNAPAGVLVLGIGAAMTVVAYRLMVRIGRLPEEERVLR